MCAAGEIAHAGNCEGFRALCQALETRIEWDTEHTGFSLEERHGILSNRKVNDTKRLSLKLPTHWPPTGLIAADTRGNGHRKKSQQDASVSL